MTLMRTKSKLGPNKRKMGAIITIWAGRFKKKKRIEKKDMNPA